MEPLRPEAALHDAVAAKEALRRKLLALRKSLPDRAARSLAITRRVCELPAYAVAKTVAAYVSVRSEVETGALLARILADGKRLALPRCCGSRTDLEFFHVRDLAELAPGSFGIPEPPERWQDDADRLVPLAEIDLVCVPGVGFDSAGMRMGYGKGHFDRTFRALRPGTTVVGLAFDAQLVDSVPSEPHDVPMHWVVAESAALRAGG